MKPLAVTMGDPAGIGPEVALKALRATGNLADCLLLGDIGVLESHRDALDWSVGLNVLDQPDAPLDPLALNVLATSELGPVVSGRVSADGGRAAFQAIKAGIEIAGHGTVSALVTAPIHKEAFASAGIDYPGHTEMLADLGGAGDVAMMLINEDIRTVLVTIHCSLSEAIVAADYEAQIRAIRFAHEGAVALGVTTPRVAVAGLNPHAGEGGLFGREEIEIIGPAVQAMKAEGIDVSGPWSGDTVFMQARQGRFDVVVAQYHDQGLIPVKYLGLDHGVNITLGLPFVRTSPDHGTGFDIAGQGQADPSSMVAALKTARQMAVARR